ncbi:MAG: stage II sporulation protein M [Chloroflexota bacterium]
MTAINIPSNERTWQTTLNNALIITRREVRDSLRDWRIIAPIITLTIFFPFLAQLAATWLSGFLSQYGAEFVGGQFIPLFLMIVGFFPISISLVIALETFVGEKERLSLEPLLSTPLTNTELYIGKALASMLPPLVAAFVGMTVYLINLSFVNPSDIPPLMVIVQMYILTLVQALVMVTGAVVVSSQATTTRSANLLASFIIIPMTLIINAEAVIIFIAPDTQSPFGIRALWGIAVAMVVVMILLLRVGNSIFNREELLGRMIDSINLKSVASKIWLYMRTYNEQDDVATNLIDWYTKSIPYTFRKLRTPILITIGVFIVYTVIGMWVGTLPAFQIPLDNDTLALESVSTASVSNAQDSLSIWWIFTNNVRVLAIGFGLSVLTLGVGGYIIIPLVFIVLGYIGIQLFSAGYGSLFLIGIVPHGLVEIPIIVIATAAMLYVGASITRPPINQTVGRAWLTAFGGAVKVYVGIILPGLLIAAIIEHSITIALVQSALSS